MDVHTDKLEKTDEKYVMPTLLKIRDYPAGVVRKSVQPGPLIDHDINKVQ
ncbi:MAG: hypothetical protein MI975_00205 [Cytophagales bacterium]|nr:hypothetical protein [Cytophagales bacterium]